MRIMPVHEEQRGSQVQVWIKLVQVNDSVSMSRSNKPTAVRKVQPAGAEEFGAGMVSEWEVMCI